MKHGSFQNLIAGSSEETPKVGMGVTIVLWTDREAGTITWVAADGKSFKYREDKAERTDSNGMSESQSYTFSPNPGAPEILVKRSRSKKAPGWKDAAGRKIVIGYRRKYHDYSF